jgi:hypothetical protein
VLGSEVGGGSRSYLQLSQPNVPEMVVAVGSTLRLNRTRLPTPAAVVNDYPVSPLSWRRVWMG